MNSLTWWCIFNTSALGRHYITARQRSVLWHWRDTEMLFSSRWGVRLSGPNWIKQTNMHTTLHLERLSSQEAPVWAAETMAEILQVQVGRNIKPQEQDCHSRAANSRPHARNETVFLSQRAGSLSKQATSFFSLCMNLVAHQMARLDEFSGKFWLFY